MKFFVVFVIFLSFSDVCAEGLFSGVFGGIGDFFSGKSGDGDFPLEKVWITTKSNTNNGGAMKVHLILVYDKSVFDELGKISARRYFNLIDQLHKDHPDKLKVIKWDLIASDNLGLDSFKVETYIDTMSVYGGYVFADYSNNRFAHRAKVPKYKEVRVVFGEEDLAIYPEDLSLDKGRVIDATNLKEADSEDNENDLPAYPERLDKGGIIDSAKGAMSQSQDSGVDMSGMQQQLKRQDSGYFEQ